jgi:hypothetical protein
MHSADDMGIIHGRTIITERRPPTSAEIGTIHILEEGGRSCAYWQGASDEPPTFLCAMATAAYNGKPELRQQFMALAAMVATGRHDVAISKLEPAAPEPWWSSLPCAHCSSVQAQDVLHRARMALELAELPTSPNGTPLGCCKLRIVGQMTSDPSLAQPR